MLPPRVAVAEWRRRRCWRGTRGPATAVQPPPQDGTCAAPTGRAGRAGCRCRAGCSTPKRVEESPKPPPPSSRAETGVAGAGARLTPSSGGAARPTTAELREPATAVRRRAASAGRALPESVRRWTAERSGAAWRRPRRRPLAIERERALGDGARRRASRTGAVEVEDAGLGDELAGVRAGRRRTEHRQACLQRDQRRLGRRLGDLALDGGAPCVLPRSCQSVVTRTPIVVDGGSPVRPVDVETKTGLRQDGGVVLQELGRHAPGEPRVAGEAPGEDAAEERRRSPGRPWRRPARRPPRRSRSAAVLAAGVDVLV